MNVTLSIFMARCSEGHLFICLESCDVSQVTTTMSVGDDRKTQLCSPLLLIHVLGRVRGFRILKRCDGCESGHVGCRSCYQ